MYAVKIVAEYLQYRSNLLRKEHTNATISERSKKILQVLAKGQALSRAAIEQAINVSPQ